MAMEMENDHTHPSKTQSGIGSRGLVELWSAQCGNCFKWRLIPTEEEFEEIRSNLIQDPFVCTKIPHISCNDPPEIEYDNTRTWAIHRPNIPKTPAGFKRRLVMRKDFSKMDCYYDTPKGKSLRSPTEVLNFLNKYPEYKNNVSVDDFSFRVPKIMEDTLPPNLPNKV